MASFQSLYNKIEYNVKKALLQVAELKEENRRLSMENENLRNQGEELLKRVADLEEKVKLTSITNTIVYKDDKKNIKKQINDWVREIDNCIDLLKNK